MIGDILQPAHLLFVLVVALLVLGPKRLPEVGRALGRGLRDFKDAVSGDDFRDALTGSSEDISHEPIEAVPPEPSSEEIADADGELPASHEAAHDSAPTDSAPAQEPEPTEQHVA